MDGQAYVKVQADAASPAAMSAAGSGGAITKSAVIMWKFEGGISGKYGWDSPKKVTPSEGNMDATNSAVSTAYDGCTLTDLLAISDCVQFS